MSHNSPNKKRKTKKQREQELLAEFEQALVELAEPRRRQGIRYPLRSVVTIGLMAMVCGADDAQAMQLWGEANEEWLDELLDLPHGTPTQDVFLAVFAALNPEEFSQVFAQWVKLLLWRKDGDANHVAIDGKTSRRTFDQANNQSEVIGGSRTTFIGCSTWRSTKTRPGIAPGTAPRTSRHYDTLLST